MDNSKNPDNYYTVKNIYPDVKENQKNKQYVFVVFLCIYFVLLFTSYSTLILYTFISGFYAYCIKIICPKTKDMSSSEITEGTNYVIFNRQIIYGPDNKVLNTIILFHFFVSIIRFDILMFLFQCILFMVFVFKYNKCVHKELYQRKNCPTKTDGSLRNIADMEKPLSVD